MRKALVLAALAAGLSSMAAAQTAQVSLKPDEVIAARQAGMSLMAGNVAAMKAGIEAGADPKGFVNSVRAMLKWANAYPALFPDGTQTGNNTHAAPAIWTDRAGFVTADRNFYAAAEKLLALAEANDKPGFAAQYTATTQTCGGCHRTYQVR